MHQAGIIHPAFRLITASIGGFRAAILPSSTQASGLISERRIRDKMKVVLRRFDALIGGKRKNAKPCLWQVSECLPGGLAENSSLDLFNTQRTCKNTSCSEWSAIDDGANPVVGISRAIWYPCPSSARHRSGMDGPKHSFERLDTEPT
jgi:hypothetical protein